MAPRLALGTVQFGLPYGLARPRHRMPAGEVDAVLAEAASAGIDMLDTAAGYGDAEKVIGERKPPAARFDVVSKTAAGIDDTLGRARQSCVALRVDSLYALLVHNSADLLGGDSRKLLAMLDEVRARGLASRIGVSVYELDELDAVLQVAKLDLVQVPLNVLDQRFAASGAIARLAAAGIEVHVRSIFLQGLLVNPAEPGLAAVAPAGARAKAFRHAMARQDLDPVQASLLYAMRQPGISRVVIGVDGVGSLRQNLAAYAAALQCTAAIDYASFAVDDFSLIDPRRWN